MFSQANYTVKVYRYQIQDLSHWCPILPLRHRAPGPLDKCDVLLCAMIHVWYCRHQHLDNWAFSVCVCVCVCVCVYSLVKTVCFHTIGLCICFVFNSNSKFKRLNLAEKGTCSKFRTRPSGARRGSVSEGPMHRFRNIFHSVLIKIFRCAFFLIAQVKMYV